MEEREGVFVHSFICNDCNLHFNVYSWKPNRHRADNVSCPECGQREGRFLHWRVTLSELPGSRILTDKAAARAFLGSPVEINKMVPHPAGGLLSDSSARGLPPTQEPS